MSSENYASTYPALSENCEDSAKDRLKNLNITIISDAAPNRNGVGTFYTDLYHHLKNYVNHIELLCPTIEDGKWNAGLVLPLPGDSTQKLCMPNPFTLQRQLVNSKPDLVIIATPGVYGLLGAFLAGRLSIPAIAGFHTSFEHLTKLYWKNSATGRVIYGYFKVTNYYLLKKCQLTLANSDAMVAQAKQLGAHAVQLIGTLISPIFSRHPVQTYQGGCKRVLFAGRLAPEKNIDTILAAAKQLPDTQFTLAGDGPERQKITQAQKQCRNLHCLGWLDREALREQIDNHDILVLPSHFESFGTIALEAMARQRLVIVSDGCGIAGWREFHEGLYVMNINSLVHTLQTIQAAGEESRLQKAEAALKITRTLNQKSLEQWFSLLTDTAKV